MKCRPILFSAPMVRALLAGTKMQTRRIVKPQPDDAMRWGGWVTCSTHRPNEGKAMWGHGELLERPLYVHCPYGQPGDRLWVRESIRLKDRWTERGARQDGEPDTCEMATSAFAADGTLTKADAWPWKRAVLPPIHCPRGLSRITLEITDVRVERLQEISEADAWAEGIADVDGCLDAAWNYQCPMARAYCDLWESINGPGSWDRNDWVWVVSFKKVAP